MVYRDYNLFSNSSVSQKDVSFAIRGSPYVAAFKIHSCTIPLAFNTTDSSNNAVVFDRAGSTKIATIPKGNYTSATFPAALQTAMNDQSTVKDFVVTFDEVTRKLTISAGSAFTINGYSGGTTAYCQLGMGKYTPSQTGTAVTGGISDFTNTAPLLLTSTQLNSKDMVYAGDENVSVLCMIDVNSPQGSVAKWINHCGSYVAVGAELPSIDLRLLNAATLLPVDLSQPFSVTLSILTDDDDVDPVH